MKQEKLDAAKGFSSDPASAVAISRLVRCSIPLGRTELLLHGSSSMLLQDGCLYLLRFHKQPVSEETMGRCPCAIPS